LVQRERRRWIEHRAINGPLGPTTLDTAKEIELCIPSTAVLP
jgi:hypothetical protein